MGRRVHHTAYGGCMEAWEDARACVAQRRCRAIGEQGARARRAGAPVFLSVLSWLLSRKKPKEHWRARTVRPSSTGQAAAGCAVEDGCTQEAARLELEEEHSKFLRTGGGPNRLQPCNNMATKVLASTCWHVQELHAVASRPKSHGQGQHSPGPGRGSSLGTALTCGCRCSRMSGHCRTWSMGVSGRAGGTAGGGSPNEDGDCIALLATG